MSITMNLESPKPFVCDKGSTITVGVRWAEWLRDFEIFAAGSGLVDDSQKCAVLQHVAGPSVREIYYTQAKTTDKYADIVKALTTHFKPLENLEFNVFNFCQLRQTKQESVDEFAIRLRSAALLCKFTDVDAEIERQIINGCRSIKLKEKILEKAGITLKEILTTARTGEAARE